MYVCVDACYEDTAIIIDGWAYIFEKMMQQGEYDRTIEHIFIRTCILTCYTILFFLPRDPCIEPG
jgi:hypothetical protein